MSHFGTVIGALLLAAIIGGCAGSPPSRFYALSPIPAAEGRGAIAGGAVSVGLGPVSFPAFLDRPQIVYRESTNRLALDEFQRWGGTVQDDFLRVWSENLAYLLGTSRVVVFPTEVRSPLDFRVTADVLAFEGTPGGEAVLKVRWSVLDPYLEEVLAVHENAYRQSIRQSAVTVGQAGASGPGDGADDRSALIAAMSACLAAFSEDVAAVVRGLPTPVQPPASATAN